MAPAKKRPYYLGKVLKVKIMRTEVIFFDYLNFTSRASFFFHMPRQSYGYTC